MIVALLLTVAAAEPLKGPDAFAAIADRADRSRALFTEAAKVLTSPRCMNCHPANRTPRQGDERRIHIPFVRAGGAMPCSTCHHASNTPVVAGSIASIPGDPHWALAPASMAWEGKTTLEICRQLKDTRRNGGRDLPAIQTHVAGDHLVAWAWRPGAGRTPAPGTQRRLGTLFSAWIATGAACPR